MGFRCEKLEFRSSEQLRELVDDKHVYKCDALLATRNLAFLHGALIATEYLLIRDGEQLHGEIFAMKDDDLFSLRVMIENLSTV